MAQMIIAIPSKMFELTDSSDQVHRIIDGDNIKIESDVKHATNDCDKKITTNPSITAAIVGTIAATTFLCHRCRSIFSTRILFEAHYKSAYNEKPIYTCQICERQCKNKRSFQRHFNRHTNLQTFPCNYCSKEFSADKIRKRHELVQHLGVAKVCCDCNAEFQDVALYKAHRRTHTARHSDASKSYKCHHCGKVMKNRSSLSVHLKIHSNDRPFGCSICQQRFVQKINLINHIKVHNAAKNFSCEECGKSFVGQAQLLRHTTQHTNVRLFECETCKKAYKTKRDLRLHTMVHEQQRPHKCAECEKTFLSTSKLKQHMNIHSGLRPYKCRHCPKDFTNFPNWLKHTRRRHKVDHKTGEKLMVMPNFLKKLVKSAKTDDAATTNGETSTNTEAVDVAAAAAAASNPSTTTETLEQSTAVPSVVGPTTAIETTEESSAIPLQAEQSVQLVTTIAASLEATKTKSETTPAPVVLVQAYTSVLSDATKKTPCVAAKATTEANMEIVETEAEKPQIVLVSTQTVPMITPETAPTNSPATKTKTTKQNAPKSRKPRKTKKTETSTATSVASTSIINTKTIQSTSGTSINVLDHIKCEEPLDIEYIEMEDIDAQANVQQTTQLETTDLSTITVNNRTLPLNTLDDLERAASLLMYPQLDLEGDLVFANIKTDQYDYEHDQFQYIDQTISYEVDSIPFADANDMSITYSYYPSGDFTMMPLPPINTVKSKRNGSCDTSTQILPSVGEYFIRRHKEKLDQL